MKVRYVRETDTLLLLSKITKGDWIDLSIAEDADIKKGDFAFLSPWNQNETSKRL